MRHALPLVLCASCLLLACGDDGDPGHNQQNNVNGNANQNNDNTAPRCGDGLLDAGEECDGTALGGESCESQGHGVGHLACAANCVLDVSRCRDVTCGNGTFDPQAAEQCDLFDLGGEDCESLGYTGGGDLACTEDCELDPSGCRTLCGNGAVEVGEACDDGGIAPEDGCGPGCQVEPGWTCGDEPSVCATTCGDGVVAGTEQCDGDDLGGLTCAGLGYSGGVVVCTDGCGLDPSGCTQVCGNGAVETGETCDDGNLDPGDGCSTTCTLETGWACAGDPSVCSVRCGDGVLLDPEACDDGNTTSGDGCSATCTEEPGWACYGIPSQCASFCGDGLAVGAEACDGADLRGETCAGLGLDGGSLRCTAGCSLDESLCTACGNGVCELGEIASCPMDCGLLGVAAGSMHTCVLRRDGSVWCWGTNISGQLGDGSTATSNVIPRRIEGLTGITAITGGAFHTCARHASGAVSCWGANTSGQLGDGTTTLRRTPVLVPGLTDVVDLAAGESHTCALHAGGAISCWGNNTRGAVGDGTTDARPTPTPVSGLTDAVSLAAGRLFTCAIRVGGAVRCWGANTEGQLGDGTTTDRLVPTGVTGIADAMQVSAGLNHACAARSTGAIACWGDNAKGQLGDGTTTDALAPVAVFGLADAVGLTAGEEHTCALREDGRVACWGENAAGQAGDGTTTSPRTAPVTVLGLTGAVALDAGQDHTCALLHDGTAWCWGYQMSEARLGDYGSTSRTAPVQVQAINEICGDGICGHPEVDCPSDCEVLQVAAGDNHACALMATGEIVCWGSGSNGQSGVLCPAAAPLGCPVPVVAAGVADAVEIAAGGSHTCARHLDGTVSCWGQNTSGQLGDGTTTSAAGPVAVSGLDDAIAIACGGMHSCALRAGGTVSCWGMNTSGQLGNASNGSSSTPVAVSNLTDAVAIDIGGNSSCAVTSTGTVWCWGPNTGGSPPTSNIPVQASGLTLAVSLSVGSNHTCAVRSDGTARCWGSNGTGQLGDGSNTPRTTPTAVTGLTGATQVAAGLGHTCARLDDGTARCWGANGSGQIGNGTTGASVLTATGVTGLTGCAQVSVGWDQSCALDGDGRVWCWGTNMSGKLGIGSNAANSPAPVRPYL